jgi:molybdopterin-binding protein
MRLTVSDAAERLGVTYSTLKQWIYKGAVRTTRTAGGHHRIADSEIERLLAAQDRPATRRQPRPAGTPIIVSISGRNRLRGIVDEIRESGLLAQVRLRIGDQRLTAVITRDAVDELHLRRGEEALAIVKSTEVMIAREGEVPPRPRRRTPGPSRSKRRASRTP